MDFSPEELDVSPPCFLVDNSQTEESQQLRRSDSDQHLSILKRLPVFAVSARTDSSICSANESVHRQPVARSCPTGGGESGGQEEPGDPRGGQGDRGHGQGGGGGGGGDSYRGGGGDGDGNNGAGGNGGTGSADGGGNDDGDDGGGDDRDNDNNNDDNEDESPPAEEPSSSSSSDALPGLIRPEALIRSNQWKGQKFSASELHVQQAAERGTHSDSSVPGEVRQQGSIGGSAHDTSGDNYSQASTGIVGEVADVAADMPSVAGSGSLSEASTAPVVSPVEALTEKKSTSSSSIGHKSEQGSAGSSSSYQGDLSSMSSGGSLGPSPEVRRHLPLHSMLRTQSTSDTSSSSAASKEDKVRGRISGFKLWSLEEKNEPETCSSQEDMFAPPDVNKEQGHVHSDLSSDGSHILPPQHHSTPSDGHSKEYHEHAHEKSLYQHVLTAKQRTSTPVEGGEFFATPPSQGTPIDTVSRFQSLQFSGEVSAKHTSSSSSDKVSLTPEEQSSIPVLVPSSPTAVEDKSLEDKSNRAKLDHQVHETTKETSSSSSDKVWASPEEQSLVSSLAPSPPETVEDKLTEEKTNRKEKSSDRPTTREANQEQSEMARAAAALVESFDLSQVKHLDKTTSTKHSEISDDDEVTLPRWQQLQKVPQQDSVSDGKKPSSSSNSSSSERPSSDDVVKGDSQPPAEVQQWQSVISAMGSTGSSSQGMKTETAGNVSTSNKEQHMQKVDLGFLESTKVPPLISKAVYSKKTEQGDQSLSPSSVVLDPFNANDFTRKDTKQDHFVSPGLTEPEISEDMFCPSITQESAECHPDIAEEPADEGIIAEDSQVIVFSLHLTQSQTDMDSQAPLNTNLPKEDNQEEVTVVSEMASVVKEDNSAETTQKEEMASLTKQDSSSQSILAPLVQPLGIQTLPSVTDPQTLKDKEQTENLAFSRVSSQHEEDKGDKEVEVDHERDPLPSTEDVAVIPPTEKPILAEDSGGVAPLRKEDTSEHLVRPQLCTPARKSIQPRLQGTIFSETSSDSGLSGGFHFSLPKEPLRALISTTPPPIRPVHHDIPDSQERGSRRSIMPDVVLPVVTETPGMSSQAPPPSSLDQVRPQSLTVSMPRHGSPLSDSENSEPVFRFHTTLPPVSTSPGSSAFTQPNSPEPHRSIFSRAREAIAKNKKREVDVDSEHDPFAFTAEDEDPEPLRKRARRASPSGEHEKGITLEREQGGTRKAPIGGTGEGPGTFREEPTERRKEQDKSKKRRALHEKVSSKRARQDGSSESAEREESGERGSKRARTEEHEPEAREKSEGNSSGAVHYQQVTHTRIVTTVTTQVQRVVTVSTIDKESGEVVQVLTYEEGDRPKIEREENEKEEVDEFVESSSVDGSRLMLTSKSPKQQEMKQLSRSSPRIKSGKTPSVSKPAASDKTKPVVATPGRSASDRGREAVVGSRKKGDRLHSRDELTSEIPAITRQATVPVTEEEPPLQRTSSSDSSIAPGTQVLAKWLDSYFYPGVVTTKQYKNGRYLVTFDDGDRRRIPRENIIIKDLLPAGQSVMAQGDAEDDFYEHGIIVGHYRDSDERGYEIQIQSGAISRFPRSRVILSEQQAADILSSESSFNITSGSSVSIGAHSLRLRKDGSAGSSGASLHNVTKSSSIEGKDTTLDTSSKDTSASSSEEKVRGKKAARSSPRANPRAKPAVSESMDLTPKSTHKSTHKDKAQVRRAGQRIAESESSSDEQHRSHAGKRRQVRRGLSAAYEAKSPPKPPSDEPLQPPTRRSPRKHMSRKEDEREEDPITESMPANRNIFAGLAFMVTGVVRDRNEPDESDSESERIEFNRDIIRRQIEAGGGVVLSSFPQSQISGAECFLVSDRYQRTQKYFQSLASGIPCVSHMWINDCCTCNKRLDYKRYLLPAGESLEAEGEIVECRPRRNILGNMRVYLHGSQQFKDTWTSVLLAAGCKMVTKIPNRFDYQCDVVICEDNKLPASVKHASNVLGIPIVSLEWLLQSLINGRQVPFDGHPKYDYRCKNA